MDVLIVVGDQDNFHETDDEIVASPIWLSDILCDEGLVAQFVVHARRAEILAEHGRDDVIRAMRRHEIGLHGRDVHPVLPEAVEGLGWEAGIQALREVEGNELDLLGRVFDVSPSCSSQHRHEAAPQAFGLAAELGIPYLFGYPAAPPLYSVSWYAGALSVPFNTPVPDFLGFFPAVFDDALPDDAAFAELFGRLQTHVERCLAVQLPLLVVFVCHPERLCYSGPLELWQYGNGANHGRAAVPAGVDKRRSRAEVERALGNFRTLIRYLRDAPGLEPTTMRTLVARYGGQADTISRSELTSLARQVADQHSIPLSGSISPAEAILGFAEALGRLGADGQVPDVLRRRDALGPTDVPPLALELPAVTTRELTGLATDLIRQVGAGGHLPAWLDVRGGRVGLGSLYGALAYAYRDAADGAHLDEQDVRELTVWPRYPELGVALGTCHRLCTEDPLVRPGLSTDAAALHAQLQTWTLKSATRDGAVANATIG